MNTCLTLPSLQGYSFHTSANSEARFSSLVGLADNTALSGFFTSVVLVILPMSGHGGEPKGSPVQTRSANPPCAAHPFSSGGGELKPLSLEIDHE